MSAPDTPVLHIRGDQMPLMLAVVAAARESCRDGTRDATSDRLADAVTAYERAIARGERA